MLLTTQQSYELLAKHGCYITEICDKCGRGIGPVRYTRRGDSGVWCSREYRGDGERQAIHKNGRPRKYRNGEESRAAKTRQQRDYRLSLGVEKTICIQSETKDLQAQKLPLSTTPLTRPHLARKTAPSEFGLRLSLLAVLYFFLASSTFAQGSMVPPQTALSTVNGITRPIAGATITVCAGGASGIPCSPALVNAIFSNTALTQPLTNPFLADSNGNYQFAIAPGTYTVTVTASGFGGYSYQLSVSCPSAGTCTYSTLTVNGTVKTNGIVNATGLQLFNTTTTCTTAATINTPCTTAAITLPVAYSDTNYRVLCQGLGPTNFPQLQTVTKSNATFTITLNNLTAAAATYSSFDCSVVHN